MLLFPTSHLSQHCRVSCFRPRTESVPKLWNARIRARGRLMLLSLLSTSLDLFTAVTRQGSQTGYKLVKNFTLSYCILACLPGSVLLPGLLGSIPGLHGIPSRPGMPNTKTRSTKNTTCETQKRRKTRNTKCETQYTNRRQMRDTKAQTR